jgi:septum formation protein
MTPSPLILASQSPRREQILRMLGFEFEIVPSRTDETPPPGLAAGEIPEALAREKALEVSRLRPEALVLGSDTLVELDGRVLGKPADAAEAVSMLRSLSGRAHRVYTGVALARGGVLLASATERTAVTFTGHTPAELEAYVRGGEPMDKAGAYAIQGRGAFLVEKIDGCFFNVMGLPVQKTLQLLAPHRLAGSSTFSENP